MNAIETTWTMTVPEAGKRYFGFVAHCVVRSAKRGEIPTIPVGGLLRVPIRAMERMLDTPFQKAASRPRAGGGDAT